jgi:hypothetical protein
VLEKIASDHPLFSAGGMPAAPIKYRGAKRKGLAASNGPQLMGLTIGGRVAVCYSREDISGGLVGQSVDGVAGYDPQSATEIMSRLLLYTSAPAQQ